jgi:hypothetical protein
MILSVEAAEELVNEIKRLKDALIYREMRVRELEELGRQVIAWSDKWASSAPSFDELRLALNSKGEKG